MIIRIPTRKTKAIYFFAPCWLMLWWRCPDALFFIQFVMLLIGRREGAGKYSFFFLLLAQKKGTKKRAAKNKCSAVFGRPTHVKSLKI
ncbi:MAG TPA: hypothetical protein VJ765_15350 [Chitinophagaceae bacterium]|nr:hypothetical protein [Chitinophagaceae bacterium]